MVQAFRDRLRDEIRARRRGRVVAYWFLIIIDLVKTAIPERIAAIAQMRWGDLVPTGGRAGMFRYIMRRLIYSIPVLLLSSIIVFAVIRSSIDPLAGCTINPRTRPEQCIKLKHELGLDRPLYVQYGKWLSHFARGDWGRSLISSRPVLPDIRTALANTAVLGLVATAFSLLIGISVGMYSALRQYSWFDHVATGGTFVSLSIPNFWFALLLQMLFGVYLTKWLHLSEPIFYTAGLTSPGSEGFHLLDRLRHLVLPMLVLSFQEIAIYSRYMRSSMIEVMQSDFLRTARAKGITETRLVARHAVRNALIPITTVASISIGAIAGGLIITESIFEYPGMGRLFVDAVQLGDYLVVLPWLMVAVTFVILFNLVADVMYAFLDPRIRYS
jgi:peptide/nickel transport system permease protein